MMTNFQFYEFHMFYYKWINGLYHKMETQIKRYMCRMFLIPLGTRLRLSNDVRDSLFTQYIYFESPFLNKTSNLIS